MLGKYMLYDFKRIQVQSYKMRYLIKMSENSYLPRSKWCWWHFRTSHDAFIVWESCTNNFHFRGKLSPRRFSKLVFNVSKIDFENILICHRKTAQSETKCENGTEHLFPCNQN